MTEPTKRQPVTDAEIERRNAKAEEEYHQFQLDQDAQMEAQWLASREAQTQDPPEDDDDLYDYAEEPDERPLGYILSCQDPYGVYTPSGQKIGSTCRCEDYPCCGH